MSIDLVFHPEIERRVASIPGGTTKPDNEHKRIEDQLEIEGHLQLLGHPGMGTPYARRMLRLKPSARWSRRVKTAIQKNLGESPSLLRILRWREELALFGLFVSTDKAPWVSSWKEDTELGELSKKLTAKSLALTEEYLELGCAYLDGGIRWSELRQKIPDRNLLK
jgi:hypothetical protein